MSTQLPYNGYIPFNVFARLMPDASDAVLGADPDALLPREMGVDFQTKELRYRDDNGKLYTLDMTRLVEDMYYPRIYECTNSQIETQVGIGTTPVVDYTAVLKPGLFPSLTVTLTTNFFANEINRVPCLVLRNGLGEVVDYALLPAKMLSGETYDVISGILYDTNGQKKSCHEPKFMTYDATYTLSLVTVVSVKATTLGSYDAITGFESNENGIQITKTTVGNAITSAESYIMNNIIQVKRINATGFDDITLDTTFMPNKKGFQNLTPGTTYEFVAETSIPITGTVTHAVIDTKYPFLQWIQNIINKVSALSDQELYNDVYATPNTLVQRNPGGETYVGPKTYYSNDDNVYIQNINSEFHAKNAAIYANWNAKDYTANSGDFISKSGNIGLKVTVPTTWKSGWTRGTSFTSEADGSTLARFGVVGGDGTSEKTIKGFYITNTTFTDITSMLYVDTMGGIFTQGKRIWTEINQGHKSGMDADKLDNQQGREYARTLIELNTTTSANMVTELAIDTSGTKQFCSHLRVVVSPYALNKTVMIYDVVVNANGTDVTAKVVDVLDHTGIADVVEFYIKATDSSNKALYVNVKGNNTYCRIMDISSFTNTSNSDDYYYKSVTNMGAIAVPATAKVTPGKLLSTFNMGEGSYINADYLRGWTIYDNLTQLGLSTTGQNTILSIANKLSDKSIAILVTDANQIAALPNSTSNTNYGTLRITRYNSTRIVVEYFDSSSAEEWFGVITSGVFSGFDKSTDTSDVDVNPTANKIIQRDTAGNAILANTLYFGASKVPYVKFDSTKNRYYFVSASSNDNTIIEAKGGFSTSRIDYNTTGVSGNGTDVNVIKMGHVNNTDTFKFYGPRVDIASGRITLTDNQEVSSMIQPVSTISNGKWYTVAKSVADGSGARGSATFRLWNAGGHHQLIFTVSAGYSTDVSVNVQSNVTYMNALTSDSKVFSDIRIMRNKDTSKQPYARDLLIQVKISDTTTNAGVLTNGLCGIMYQNSGTNLWLSGDFIETNITNYDLLKSTVLNDGSTFIVGDKARVDGDLVAGKDVYSTGSFYLGTNAVLKYDPALGGVTVMDRSNNSIDVYANNFRAMQSISLYSGNMEFNLTSANSNPFLRGLRYIDTNASNALKGLIGLQGTGGQPTSFIVADGTSSSRGGANNIFYVDRSGNIEVNSGKKVWTELNDGHGSGLDADKIDTFEATDLSRVIASAATTNTPTVLNLKYNISGSFNPIIHHFRVLGSSTYSTTTNGVEYDVILNVFKNTSSIDYTCKVISIHPDGDPLNMYINKDTTNGVLTFKIALNTASSVKVIDQSFVSSMTFANAFSTDTSTDTTGTVIQPVKYLTVASASIPASTLNGWKIYTEISSLGLSGAASIISIVEAMQDKSLLFATTNALNIEALPNSSTYQNQGTLEITRLSADRCEIRYTNYDSPDLWVGVYRAGRSPKFSGFRKVIMDTDTSLNIVNNTIPIRDGNGGVKVSRVYFDNDNTGLLNSLSYNKASSSYLLSGNGSSSASLTANNGFISGKTTYGESGITTSGLGSTFNIGHTNGADSISIYGGTTFNDPMYASREIMSDSTLMESISIPLITLNATTNIPIAIHAGGTPAYSEFIVTYSDMHGMHGYIKFTASAVYGCNPTITIHDTAIYVQSGNTNPLSIINEISIQQIKTDLVYGGYILSLKVTPDIADLPAGSINVFMKNNIGARTSATNFWSLVSNIASVDYTKYTSIVAIPVKRGYSIQSTNAIIGSTLYSNGRIYANGSVFGSDYRFNATDRYIATDGTAIQFKESTTGKLVDIQSKTSTSDEVVITQNSQYGITFNISNAMTTNWRRGLFFKDAENSTLVGSIALNGGDGSNPDKVLAFTVSDTTGTAPTQNDYLLYVGSDGTTKLKGKKIWSEYNQGSDSGMDADTTDGWHFVKTKPIPTSVYLMEQLINLPAYCMFVLNATVAVGTTNTPSALTDIPEAGFLRVIKTAYDNASLELITGSSAYYASLNYNASAPPNSTISAWTKVSNADGNATCTVSALSAGTPSTLKSGGIWIATY